jgi:hypothetical protein
MILASISRRLHFLPINLTPHTCNVASFGFGSAFRLCSSIFGIDERRDSPFVWSVLSMQRTHAPTMAPSKISGRKLNSCILKLWRVFTVDSKNRIGVHTMSNWLANYGHHCFGRDHRTELNISYQTTLAALRRYQSARNQQLFACGSDGHFQIQFSHAVKYHHISSNLV